MSEIIKMLQEEIAALKIKGGKLIEENTILKGFKAIVMEDPTKYDDRGPNDLTRQIGELECELAGLKTKNQELQNEMILIKGITVTNSPELRDANKKIKELEARLAEVLNVEDDHQKLNGKMQMRLTEIEQENIDLMADNKKLARQIEDQLDRARRAGL